MRKIILVVICCMLVCTGCNRQVELTEEEAFKGVDDIITDQQINIHFALKERPLHELDSYLLGLSIESPWGESMIPSMTYSPFNKKLGVKIRAEGKEWMIGYLIQIIGYFKFHVVADVLVLFYAAEQLVKVIVLFGVHQVLHHSEHTVGTFSE